MDPQPDTTPAPSPGRRTQSERRTATRSILMEATISCLVERGYSATTTLEVERRAGVSRGARLHHFPTKALLLASAVDHLYSQLGDHYEHAFGHSDPSASDARRLGSGLRVLWSVYCRPRYLAVLELNVAARTDEELRARLIEVGEHHRAAAVRAAERYFPTLSSAAALPLVELLNASLLGLLMQRHVNDDPARDEAVLALLEATVVSHLPSSHPSGAQRR